MAKEEGEEPEKNKTEKQPPLPPAPNPHQSLQNWDSLPNMRILSHKEETDVHGWNLHVALFSSRIQ